MQDKNIAYNYLLSFLVKECVLANFNSPKLIFHLDQHTIKVASKNSFTEYIKIRAYAKWNFQGELEIRYWDSDKHTLIQIADVLSNTVYQKHQKNKILAFQKIDFAHKIHFPFKSFN